VPKKWGEFFGVGGRAAAAVAATRKGKKKSDDDSAPSSSPQPPPPPPPPPPPSYTLPISVLALRERAEENIVAFLPNYLRALALLVLLLAALGGKPLSLVGLACLAAFAVANARGLLGGPSMAETLARQQQLMLEQQQRAAAIAAGQPAPPPSASQQRRGAEEPTPPVRAAATIFVYGVAAYTRAFAPLTRGIALSLALTALHASLRVAATERASWASALSEQGRRESSKTYLLAGVPFRDVFFGSSAAPRGSQKREEDPRRCLREVTAAARALTAAAVIGVKAGAAAAVDAGVAKLKALRQQLR